MRGKGLEPLQPSGHKALNLARLPNSATRAHGGHVWPRLGHVKQPKSLVPIHRNIVFLGHSDGLRSQVAPGWIQGFSVSKALYLQGRSRLHSRRLDFWLWGLDSQVDVLQSAPKRPLLEGVIGQVLRGRPQRQRDGTATTVVARESMLPAPRGPNMEEEDPPPNAAPTSEPLEG